MLLNPSSQMISDASILLVVIACFACMLGVRMVCEHRMQFDLLREALMRTLRGEPSPPTSVRMHDAAHRVLDTVKHMTMQRREWRLRQGAQDTDFSVTNALLRAIARVDKEQDVVTDVLLKQLQPDVTVVAHVSTCAESGSLELVAISGMPRARVEQLILRHIEEVRDGLTEELPHEETLLTQVSWNLRGALRMSSGVLVPVRSQAMSHGYLWVGLSREQHTLPTHIRHVLRSAAQQLAVHLELRGESHVGAQQDVDREVILGLSHDLRAPGNSALYAVRLLLDDDVALTPEDRRLHTQIVEHAVYEQQRLVSDLLDFAKHEQGELKPNVESIDLKPIIDDIVRREGLTASSKDIVLESTVCNPCFVRADEQHVNRILANLISNALKYTEQGSVTIHASSESGRAKISISDTGVGIALEEEAQLFKPFRRLSNTKRTAGSGLGLAVSRMLAEVNEGALRFERRAGGGSTFVLELRSTESLSDPAIADFQAIRVLVVEDDEAATRTYRRYLRESGVRMEAASSIAAAREYLAADEFDLVLSDFSIGAENAGEFIREISRDIPVLLISAWERHVLQAEFHEMDSVIILNKPLHRTQLLAAIGESIQQPLLSVCNAQNQDDGKRHAVC